MKLFEYCVLYHPKQTKAQQEAGESAKSELVVDVQRVLAADEKQVGMIAARAIPENLLGKLDRVEIAIRPF